MDWAEMLRLSMESNRQTIESNRIAQEAQREETKRARQEGKAMIKEFIGILPTLVTTILKANPLKSLDSEDDGAQLQHTDQAQASADSAGGLLGGSTTLTRCANASGSVDVERTPSSAPHLEDTVPTNLDSFLSLKCCGQCMRLTVCYFLVKF
jgi:hypothetical protein